MSGFLYELWADLRARTRLSIWLFCSVLATAIGPLATWSIESPLIRFAFWAGVSMLGISIALTTRLLLRRLAPGLGRAWQTLLVGLAVGLILTPVTLHLVGRLVSPGYAGMRPDWTLFFIVTAIPLLVDFIRYFALRPPGAPAAQEPGERPRLWHRLPKECHGEILHLSGRNHHVEVRTDQCKCRIRLRLRDAIAELDQIDGLCVHRSHWVAVAAIVGSEWNKRRPVLVLRDGTRVPVSQKYEPEVIARKLIEAP